MKIKRLLPVLIILAIGICITLMWNSQGCRKIRKQFFSENYSLVNCGEGIRTDYFYSGYYISGPSILDIKGPESEVEYKNSFLPINPKVQLKDRIDLQGNIISLDINLREDHKYDDLYVFYENNSHCYFAHIEESAEFGFKLLKTRQVGGAYLLYIDIDYKTFYVQSNNFKEIYIYNIDGAFVRKFVFEKPLITSLLDCDDQNVPTFIAFDGHKMFTFKDGKMDEILKIETNNGINNSFFFTQTTHSTPFWQQGTSVQSIANMSFDLLFYDGQYLYAIDINNKNIFFKIKIDGLKLGALNRNYIVAPYNEGICLIDTKTGELTNLLKTNAEFMMLDYGGTIDDKFADVFFNSYSNGQSVIKGWRFGERKKEIISVGFSPVNDKIKHMRGFGFLIFLGDKGIYYTNDMYTGWNDITW